MEGAVIVVERKIGFDFILINLEFQVIYVIKWFIFLAEAQDLWYQNILTALGYERDYGLKS